MSVNAAAVSRKEAYPVQIGDMKLYCEHFRIVGTRNFSEKTTVSGDAFFSNTGKRALRITLEGRIYDEELPLGMVLYSDGYLTSDSSFTIEYRGIEFTGCRIQSFSAEDSGEDYIRGSLTLVTVDSSVQREAEQDDG